MSIKRDSSAYGKLSLYIEVWVSLLVTKQWQVYTIEYGEIRILFVVMSVVMSNHAAERNISVYDRFRRPSIYITRKL